jgi:hypothetical protein
VKVLHRHALPAAAGKVLSHSTMVCYIVQAILGDTCTQGSIYGLTCPLWQSMVLHFHQQLDSAQTMVKLGEIMDQTEQLIDESKGVSVI